MVITRPVAKWILDGLLSLIVLLIILSSYLGWIIPFRQGFHCGDPSLQYVFHGDTISLAVLLAICIFFPLFFMVVTETLRHKVIDRPKRSIVDPLTSPAAPSVSKSGRKSIFRVCFYFYYTYLHGLLCTVAVVEFLKMTVGGLRPHFFDSCRPDYTSINCSSGFITSYTCTQERTVYLLDTFKSFPSGHAAMSLYMSLFLCFYMNKQLFSWPTSFSNSLVQSLLLFWAGYCAASRVIDHRHHWWDVVTGCILGVVCACHTAMWLWVTIPSAIDGSGSPNSSSTLLSRQNNENEPRHQRRRLLSSQASQTTEISETNLSTSSSSPQQTNHFRV